MSHAIDLCSTWNPSALPSYHSIFERMYIEEFDFVERTVRRYGVQSQDAADIAQDVFFVVYHRIGTYDVTRPAKSWLYAFATYIAGGYRCLVRHKREILCELPPEKTCEQPSAEQILLAREAHSIALQVLEPLQPDLRAVLLLHDVEEKTMPEIAAKLGIPLNTGYTKLRRAREQIRRHTARAAKTAQGIECRGMLRRLCGPTER